MLLWKRNHWKRTGPRPREGYSFRGTPSTKECIRTAPAAWNDHYRQEDTKAAWSLSFTYVVQSYTLHIHRFKPLPVDDGKRNPHPLTTLESNLKPVLPSHKAARAAWGIQNCILSVLWQETWSPTPFRPTARWLSSCEVRSAERMENVWESHCEEPYSAVICHPDTFQRDA